MSSFILTNDYLYVLRYCTNEILTRLSNIRFPSRSHTNTWSITVDRYSHRTGTSYALFATLSVLTRIRSKIRRPLSILARQSTSSVILLALDFTSLHGMSHLHSHLSPHLNDGCGWFLVFRSRFTGRSICQRFATRSSSSMICWYLSVWKLPPLHRSQPVLRLSSFLSLSSWFLTSSSTLKSSSADLSFLNSVNEAAGELAMLVSLYRDMSIARSAAVSMTEFRDVKLTSDGLRVELEVKSQLDKDVSHSPVIEVGGERDTNIVSSVAVSMTDVITLLENTVRSGHGHLCASTVDSPVGAIV